MAVAVRGVPGRRVGGPLAGVLRDLDRRTRRTARRSAAPEELEELEEGPGRVAAGPVALIVRAGEDGRAVLWFPRPFADFPVVGALPLVAGGAPAVAVLEEVTCKRVVVRVWVLGSGGPVAMAGVAVHVTAVESN